MHDYATVEPFVLGALFQVLFAIGAALVCSSDAFGYSKQSNTDIQFVRALDASQAIGAFTVLAVALVTSRAMTWVPQATLLVLTGVAGVGAFYALTRWDANRYDQASLFHLFSPLNYLLIVLNLAAAGYIWFLASPAATG